MHRLFIHPILLHRLIANIIAKVWLTQLDLSRKLKKIYSAFSSQALLNVK